MNHLTQRWAYTVADSFKDVVMDRQRLGRCYELAYRWATGEGMGWTLVHGTIKGHGVPRIGHAFCLDPDEASVYEPATDNIWSKEAFEREFDPTWDHTFETHDIMVNSMKYGHYGPWDGTVGPMKP